MSDNGGSTQTQALGLGSSAINAANPANCPTTDQRGYPRRLAYGACDIGAYEAQLASLAAVGGSAQSAAINTAFALALQASVADDYGNLLAGSLVTFTTPSAGPSAAWGASQTLTRTTDTSGLATASTLTANGTVGAFFASATTGVVSATFALSNLRATTTTTITSSANPAVVSNTVTFTVTVTSPSGMPGGTVDFYETLSPAGLGTQSVQVRAAEPLVGGMVTFSASSLTVGTHNLLAIYNGDTNYTGSTSALYAQVIQAAPRVKVYLPSVQR